MEQDTDSQSHSRSSVAGGEPPASRCPFLNGIAGAQRRFRRPRRLEGYAAVPGPRGWPGVGSLPEFAADPIRFFERLRGFGDVAHFRMAGRDYFHLHNPEDIRNFLVRDHAKVRRAGIMLKARSVLGNGLLTSDGNDHRRQKRLLWPAFSPEALRRYGNAIEPEIRRSIAGWKDRDVIDVGVEMNKIALAVVATTLFGRELYEQSESLQKAVTEILAYFDPSHGPFGAIGFALAAGHRSPRFASALRLIDRTVDALIDAERKHPGGESTLMSLLIRESERENSELTATELRDQALTMLMAGHETVATSLTWTLYALSQSKDSEDRLRDEIARAPGGAAPEPREIIDRPFLDRVVKESLRLFPPIWAMKRVTTEDYPVGPYLIPAGSLIGVSQFITHRDPRYYANPTAFDPDRWTDEEAARRPAYSYFPFGGGPHVCIGARFGLMEIKIALDTLLRLWRFEFVSGKAIGFKPLITLRPKNPIRAAIRLQTARPSPFRPTPPRSSRHAPPSSLWRS